MSSSSIPAWFYLITNGVLLILQQSVSICSVSLRFVQGIIGLPALWNLSWFQHMWPGHCFLSGLVQNSENQRAPAFTVTTKVHINLKAVCTKQVFFTRSLQNQPSNIFQYIQQFLLTLFILMGVDCCMTLLSGSPLGTFPHCKHTHMILLSNTNYACPAMLAECACACRTLTATVNKQTFRNVGTFRKVPTKSASLNRQFIENGNVYGKYTGYV